MNQVHKTISNNQLKEDFYFRKVAKQANGSVWYTQGKAVLIATVVADTESVEDDFLPMTVQYIEKSYAAAKVPGGFIKRESKPSDFETLTSRIIDRSIRPIFPKGFNYPITITILVVSSDSNVDMQVAAIHAANAALLTSNIPINKSIAATRVGMIDGNIILNPTLEMQEKSTLDLLVSGSHDDIIMIEMRAIGDENNINDIEEGELGKFIQSASRNISELSKEYEKEFLSLKPTPIEFKLYEISNDKEFENYLMSNFAKNIKETILHMAKSERSNALKELQIAIEEDLKDKNIEFDTKNLKETLAKLKAQVMRDMVLNEKIRADGRALDEVRAITIETNILPSVHGSCLFTRGQTQALVTATLGDKKDSQSYELITEKNSRYENFMVHYNFPGFSVGDSKPIGPTNRRELGHGNLAKRALECSVNVNQNQTIRVVSEVLESNGSSSMATVCGGSLAIVAAGVEVKSLIAGVAMGLIKENDKYVVMTDIMGLEDYEGDMDFKVAGPSQGVSSMQMDIKLDGIGVDIVKDAIVQAKKAKQHILGIMQEASNNIKPSLAVPKIEHFLVPVSKIGDIIGKAGSTIREIIEKFEVSIDIDRDKGGVKISGQDENKLTGAKDYIQNIVNSETKEPMVYEIGAVYKGKVKKITDFGVFVEMPDGFDALLHISKVDKSRVDNLNSIFKIDDIIDIVVIEQNGKKIELATPAFLN
ncbi:MAG: polyribonucleotide nucleotidyltransferase [Sulfurovaceae bacterium]|nr:polyribonucleotide nucleotidyltransferase [Sulfurovaceae bacterium]MDD5548091.1 polyribonucleotide nucleotidyltransferase [Sulfurovaceae bacterium]